MNSDDDLLRDLVIDRFEAPTPDGWQLGLKRTRSPAHFRPAAHPVVIIPGYGMNSFIFGFHPRGTSMERSLAEAGFEVWSANLRQQGSSRPRSASAVGPSLRAYAEVDMKAVVDAVLEHTESEARTVDLIGASLGGSIAYAYLALVPDAPVHALCTVGAPLRWTALHPAVRIAFASPLLAGALSFTGTRALARRGMGILTRYPGLLSMYMNAAHVDLTEAATLAETVEDPVPRVNKDLALWMRAGDMVLRGMNVTHALARLTQPLLVVISNRDGIVPENANLSVRAAWGGSDVEILRIGDDRDWYAHADLFIADRSPELLFGPIARWLSARREAPAC